MNRSYYEGLVKRNNKYVQKLSYMNSNEKTIIQINFNLLNLYKDDRTIIKFEMMDKERDIEIAKSMLFDDVPLKNISKYTGLSIKEIELLK